MNTEQLTEEIFLHIKKMKHPFMNIDTVSDLIREKIGDSYTSQIGIEVKESLVSHEKLDFFREGDYIHENKFVYCTGSWLALKGLYENPVQAKNKLGWFSWQTSEEINWAEV